MKKFVISIVAICAMMIFVACGGNTSDKKDNNGDKTDSTDTEEENDGDKTDTGDTGDKTDTSDTGDTGDKTDTEDPSDSGDSTSDEDTADTSDSTDEGDTEQADSGSDDNLYAKFVGRWAAEVILHADSVALGIPAPSITTRYFLVDFYVNEKGQLDMDKVDNKLCSTKNRTGKRTATAASNVLFNDSKFNTIFHHWKPYDIEGQEDTPYVEVAKDGAATTFKLNKDYELRGANMDNPATENMISKSDDSRIFDHDNDGKPAFTLGIKGKSAISTGTMYYVQRLWHVFEGSVVAADKIEGKVDWSDEQYLVDATNSTLKAPKNTTTDPNKSIFQFRKVDNAMDCDAMLGQLDTIFDLVDANAGDAEGVE